MNVKCIQVDGKLAIRVNFGEQITYACGNGETKFTVDPYNITYLCPEDLESYCQVDNCPDYCGG